MGIVVGPAVWIGNAHPVHQLDRAPAGCAARRAPVGPEHLPDLVRDREHRVQGGERVRRNTLSGMARPFEDRLAEARRLIADAGLSEGFTLKLLFPTGAGGIYERTFAVIADRLERFLPVTVESIALPRAEMRERRASGDWHIASEFVYELLGDPQGWAGYFTTTGVSNFTGYSNPVVDNLFTEQAQALDPAERARLVQETQLPRRAALRWDHHHAGRRVRTRGPTGGGAQGNPRCRAARGLLAGRHG